MRADRLTPDLIEELCKSPTKMLHFDREQATKYPKAPITSKKRKAVAKVGSDRVLKAAKMCDMYGMKEKDALDKALTDSVSNTSWNDDASTSSARLRDFGEETSAIELDLRRLCALCKLTCPEIKASAAPKNGQTAKVTTKGLYEDEYTVSRVNKVEFFEKRPRFEVKWEGYDEATWEPIENIWDCAAFQAYTNSFIRDRKRDMEELWKELITTITSEGLEPILTDRQALEQIKKFNYNDYLAHFFVMVRMKRAGIKNTAKDYKAVHAFLINDMKHLSFYFRRLEQLQNMHEFQQRINMIDQAKSLHVVNDVDLEPAPMDEFIYTNDVIPRDGIVIPDDPPIGCECTDVCSAKSGCCPSQFDSEFAYNARGIIRVKQGTPIFECNKACKCPENCPNRVVQKGRKQTLSIFKTKDRGWGVRTQRAIAKGQFICEYVGEIISYEETERRGKQYDAVGRTYLFDLDFNERDNPYTVDAAKYGNVSRFINHSCDPNVGVWAVWTNCLDLNLPKLCLFTLRAIKEKEELTFDYCSNREPPNEAIVVKSESIDSWCEPNTAYQKKKIEDAENSENTEGTESAEELAFGTKTDKLDVQSPEDAQDTQDAENTKDAEVAQNRDRTNANEETWNDHINELEMEEKENVPQMPENVENSQAKPYDEDDTKEIAQKTPIETNELVRQFQTPFQQPQAQQGHKNVLQEGQFKSTEGEMTREQSTERTSIGKATTNQAKPETTDKVQKSPSKKPDEETAEVSDRKAFTCRCGAAKCRKIIFC